jgi:hypothetical protein
VTAILAGYNSQQVNDLRDRTAFLAMNQEVVEQKSLGRDEMLYKRDNLLYQNMAALAQTLIDQGVLEVPEQNERAR